MNSASGECTEHHRHDFLHIAHTETQVDWKQSTSIVGDPKIAHLHTCANYTGFISMLATWCKRVHIKLNEKGALPKNDENGHRIKNKYNSIKGQRVSALLLTKPNILPMFALFASILNEVSSVIRQSTWKKLNLNKSALYKNYSEMILCEQQFSFGIDFKDEAEFWTRKVGKCLQFVKNDTGLPFYLLITLWISCSFPIQWIENLDTCKSTLG